MLPLDEQPSSQRVVLVVEAPNQAGVSRVVAASHEWGCDSLPHLVTILCDGQGRPSRSSSALARAAPVSSQDLTSAIAVIVLLFTSMDPAEALEAAESALREAVRLALPDWERMPGAPNLDELRRRKAAEAKRRDGTLVEADNLAYTELHQLETLIIKNWEKFSPMFGDLARTKVYLAALLDYRNAVAHSRELAASNVIFLPASVVRFVIRWFSTEPFASQAQRIIR